MLVAKMAYKVFVRCIQRQIAQFDIEFDSVCHIFTSSDSTELKTTSHPDGAVQLSRWTDFLCFLHDDAKPYTKQS